MKLRGRIDRDYGAGEVKRREHSVDGGQTHINIEVLEVRMSI